MRFARRPSLGLAAGVGALVALAALTRGEALLLVPLLLLPLAFRGGHGVARAPHARRGGAWARSCLVLAPWTIRNLTVFEQPVLISTNGNAVFVGSNCDAVYHGEFIGLWNFDCYGKAPGGDESEQAAEYRDRGFDYARDHAGRVPLVMGVRFLRVWDLYRPRQQASYEVLEGRSETASRIGLAMYYPLLLLAVGRRGDLRPPAPLAAVAAARLPGDGERHRGADLRRHALPVRRRAGPLRAGGGGASAAAASTMKTRVRAGISQSQSTPA